MLESVSQILQESIDVQPLKNGKVGETKLNAIFTRIAKIGKYGLDPIFPGGWITPPFFKFAIFHLTCVF